MHNIPHRILVAGSGLVGALLAVMLGQRGYQVALYEKRPDLRKTRISAGRSINLALAERGVDALKRAGIFSQVQTLLTPMRGRMLHAINGELEFSPYGQWDNEVIYSVSRGDLNCLMMTAAEQHPNVKIYFEQLCEAVDWEKNQVSIVDLRDNTRRSVDFSLLIGCDGASSAVRQAIIKATSGTSTYDLLDHGYKEITLPAGPGNVHQIEREALHIWPRGGFMLIALPNSDGSFTVTLFLPRKGSPSFAELQTVHAVQEFFLEQFPDACAMIPDLSQQFFANPMGELGTMRCYPWSYGGRSLILGDAAHAIVPFHGQGMNAGFEDCALLLKLLDENDEDWPATMELFQQRRKQDADAIANMALENYITMRESVAQETFQLKKLLGFELERRFPDRFVPRYSMVMFRRYPYAEVFNRGNIQNEILDRLLSGENDINHVDFSLAEELVMTRLSPLE
ncbi:MAG TPA: NAD(P)/FAD-dependent oxidoreductase [Pirellulaceae bacterium]|nr:NAD(P)/FAD-dependent oxidoreductase [Pirellulaceae bacterium]HMO91782.1 NAD(P)/FAD-dependent oxidoreductase [Pirellulaceae bacterium]HMP69581.1 NAD(P)/FAD-dependent oxidoreductase [Pirellulaceae bacterium]